MFKGTSLYSFLYSYYVEFNNACTTAAAYRAQDALYKQWQQDQLLKKSQPSPTPQPQPQPQPSPAPSNGDQSNNLFGKYDPKAGTNDTYFNYQRTSEYNRVGIESVWQNKTRLCDTPITVIDSGADTKNSEIADSINVKDSYNFYEKKAALNPQHFHGTFVTSVISAKANNKNATAGTCWRANITELQVTNPQGSATTSDLVAAMNNTANRTPANSKTSITNISMSILDALSLGVNSASGKPFADAIKAMASKNILVVVAAGNSSRINGDASIPKTLTNAIFVGATNPDGLASFSNYAGAASLYAPGQDLYGASLNNQTVKASGTSFSAPLVSGIAALYLQVNPSASPAKVIECLTKTADVLKDPKLPGGMPTVNAAKLMDCK